ncbi:MAG: chemotaxis protein CheW [Leptolyngbyaceae cyanobacterium MO_188.B28]|nr:chemotaxis protein CheW [Leptolyngbyaceae cyanobacterium MO_188.B28]
MSTQTSLDRLQSLLPEVFNPTPQTGDLYLKFNLGSSLKAVISLSQIVETLRIPAQSITPIPNMPAYTLGLMGSQGKIFWAIDLAQLLRVPQKNLRSRQYEVIVVEALSFSPADTLHSDNGAEGLLLGLSVQQIQRTLRFLPDELEPAPVDAMPGLLPFMQGRVKQNGDEMLILNVEAIFNAQCLSSV